jgi:hypothetical protein
MELKNLAPNTKISIKISNWTHKTTIQDYETVVADPRKVDAVAQAIETLDQGLTSTVNLAGVAGFFHGCDVSIDLV